MKSFRELINQQPPEHGALFRVKINKELYQDLKTICGLDAVEEINHIIDQEIKAAYNVKSYHVIIEQTSAGNEGITWGKKL